jgi:hypothetical protein
MFKKSSTNKQFDLFNSPSDLMCGRESRQYDAPSAWHNKFYREVTSHIDEEMGTPDDVYRQGGLYKEIFDASARSMNADKIAATTDF